MEFPIEELEAASIALVDGFQVRDLVAILSFARALYVWHRSRHDDSTLLSDEIRQKLTHFRNKLDGWRIVGAQTAKPEGMLPAHVCNFALDLSDEVLEGTKA